MMRLRILVILIATAMVLLPACRPHTDKLSNDTVSSLAVSILTAARAKDISALMSMTVAPNGDMEQVAQNLKHFGWQPPNLSREQLNAWKSATKSDISIFLASYEDLFEKKPVVVVSHRLDLSTSVVETPSGTEPASVIYGHLEPQTLIIWVQTGSIFKGIYVPGVYKIGAGYKVNDWVTLNQHFEGQLVKERAVLEAKDLKSCTFPEVIKWEREFKR